MSQDNGKISGTTCVLLLFFLLLILLARSFWALFAAGKEEPEMDLSGPYAPEDYIDFRALGEDDIAF